MTPLDGDAQPFSKESQTRGKRPYGVIDVDAAWRRYQAGETTVQIAADYSVSATAVQQAFKRRGFRLIPHWERKSYPDNLARSNAAKKAKTHCKNGHEYAEVGVYIKADGFRDCKGCRREGLRKRRRAERARGITREKWGLSRKPGGPHRCRNCPKPAAELHHAIPRGKAPHARSDVRNGLPLCLTCHDGWHSKEIVLYRDLFTAEEWAFVSSVELTGERIKAWLDRHYPPR